MKPTEIPGSTTPGPMCCRRSCRRGVGLRWGWGGRDGLLCTWAGGRVAFLWVGMLGSEWAGAGEPPGGGKTACQL